MDKFISVIIPTLNSQATLDKCLDSIFSNINIPPFDVTVVDGGVLGFHRDDAVLLDEGARSRHRGGGYGCRRQQAHAWYGDPLRHVARVHTSLPPARGRASARVCPCVTGVCACVTWNYGISEARPATPVWTTASTARR